MKKSDLKNGMIVETKQGEKFLLMNERLLEMNNKGSYPFKDINEDLTDALLPNWDIVKVFETNPTFISRLFDEDNLTLIWERKRKLKVGDHVKIIGNEGHSFKVGIIGEIIDEADSDEDCVVEAINHAGIVPYRQFVNIKDLEYTTEPLTTIEAKEMTIQEIEDVLGHPVKVVK